MLQDCQTQGKWLWTVGERVGVQVLPWAGLQWASSDWLSSLRVEYFRMVKKIANNPWLYQTG